MHHDDGGPAPERGGHREPSRTTWRRCPPVPSRRDEWPVARRINGFFPRAPPRVRESYETEHPSVLPPRLSDTCPSLTVRWEDDRIVSIRGSRANPTRPASLREGSGGVSGLRPRRGASHGAGCAGWAPRGRGASSAFSWARRSISSRAVLPVIAAHGPQAILPLTMPGRTAMLAGGSMDLRFFHRLGASLLDRRPSAAASAPRPGSEPSAPRRGAAEQAEHSKLIIAWGSNVDVSNSTSCRSSTARVGRAPSSSWSTRGGRRSPSRPICTSRSAREPTSCSRGRWRRARAPGRSDREFIARHVAGFEDYMALAAATHWPTPPESAASTRASWRSSPSGTGRSPAVITVGNGSSATATAAAASARSSPSRLRRKVRRAGGGLITARGSRFRRRPRAWRADLVRPARVCSTSSTSAATHRRDAGAADQGALHLNHNPLVVHPDQNRLRRGSSARLFVVGSDVVMTDSLAYADVVLRRAATSSMRLFAAYGTHWLQRATGDSRRRARPCPTPRSSAAWRRASVRRPGVPRQRRRADERRARRRRPRMGGKRPSAIPLDRATAMTVRRGRTPSVQRTCSRERSRARSTRVAVLEGKYGARLPSWRPVASSYPLTLISPASDQRINVDLRWWTTAATQRIDERRRRSVAGHPRV